MSSSDLEQPSSLVYDRLPIVLQGETVKRFRGSSIISLLIISVVDTYIITVTFPSFTPGARIFPTNTG